MEDVDFKDFPPYSTQWWCAPSVEYKGCLIFQDKTELREFYVPFLEIFGRNANFFRLCDAKTAIADFLWCYENSLY